MEPRSLKYVCDSCPGDLQTGSADQLFRRVCIDSRHVRAGDLFFALVGERFDGHSFLPEVARKGVTAVVTGRDKAPGEPLGCGVITVENTRYALGRLAARYRSDFQLPVIAVAGSNGKTTTKELLAAVLRQKFNTAWSEASFNNDVGVPLTLLQLERSHEAAVLEAGTNHPGELAPLIRMIHPQFGVLTNIGREHLEFFGDLPGVAEEEGWLAELLPPDGKLFLNGDSEWAPAIESRSKTQVVRCGFGENNHWRAGDVFMSEAGLTFEAVSPRREFNGEYRIHLLGRHQAVNALLALAVGAELGVSPEEARAGLESCQPAKMRLQIREINGVRVLDDSYNANADSMLVALQTLGALPCAGRRIAVLGDMAELGPHAAEAHREVGRYAAGAGVDYLIAVGKSVRQTAQAARAAGLENVTEFADVESAVAAVKTTAQPGDLVLLKASRASGLERISEALGWSQKS
jgi:UDP-N-acetylmuramoyl-tripeptide--D-alanyl-D-alanine ligase